LTTTAADEDMPFPSPDGRWIAFTLLERERTPGRYSIQLIPAQGGGTPRALYRRARDVWPLDWSDDGRFLLLGTGQSSGSANVSYADSLGVLAVDDPSTVHWLQGSSGQFSFASFSHDGRWVAYGTSNPDPQIYLEPSPAAAPSTAPGGTGRLQISPRGGTIPRWRGDDRELYYARPDGMIVAVPLAPRTLQPGREVELFRTILRPANLSLD